MGPGWKITYYWPLSVKVPRRARPVAGYGTTGAPGAGLGMRKVYTTPNTMVRPFVVANALYSFSNLKNTFIL